jgi:hypothetical protein
LIIPTTIAKSAPDSVSKDGLIFGDDDEARDPDLAISALSPNLPRRGVKPTHNRLSGPLENKFRFSKSVKPKRRDRSAESAAYVEADLTLSGKRVVGGRLAQIVANTIFHDNRNLAAVSQ